MINRNDYVPFITKDLLNDILIYLQDNGFVINERPHLRSDGSWVVKAFSQILSPTQPVIVQTTKKMVDAKIKEGLGTKILRVMGLKRKVTTSGTIVPVWKTTSKEVANQVTTYRFWFLTMEQPFPHVDLHIDRVPRRSDKVYNKDQQPHIDRSIKAGKYDEATYTINRHVRVPMQNVDSITQFKKEIESWL